MLRIIEADDNYFFDTGEEYHICYYAMKSIKIARAPHSSEFIITDYKRVDGVTLPVFDYRIISSINDLPQILLGYMTPLDVAKIRLAEAS